MGKFLNRSSPPPLEDHFGDVLTKAQVGHSQGKRTLAETIGVDPCVVKRWHEGLFEVGDEAALEAAANELRLHGPSLLRLARGEAGVPPLENDEVAALNFPFGADMTVNAWALRGSGIIFDTGLDAEAWRLHERQLAGPLTHLFLTHGHRDHVGALAALREAYPGVAVYAHPAESIDAAIPIEEGDVVACAGIIITARHTPGHSPGGMSYRIDGLARPMIVCGDALFACSVGGIRRDYADALTAIREKILGEPPATVLLPGHGPATTVATERAHNPFFANAFAGMQPSRE